MQPSNFPIMENTTEVSYACSKWWKLNQQLSIINESMRWALDTRTLRRSTETTRTMRTTRECSLQKLSNCNASNDMSHCNRLQPLNYNITQSCSNCWRSMYHIKEHVCLIYNSLRTHIQVVLSLISFISCTSFCRTLFIKQSTRLNCKLYTDYAAQP